MENMLRQTFTGDGAHLLSLPETYFYPISPGRKPSIHSYLRADFVPTLFDLAANQSHSHLLSSDSIDTF